MKPSWQDKDVKNKNLLELLVYRSRLIGSEARLCVWGGGNTSSKMTEPDHLGRDLRVLRVKGSGSDLKTSVPKDYSPLRLDEVLPARAKESMTDEEMVDYLQRCLVDPKAPRPSIEALLHAFVPFQAIDHTHADAILSLTNISRPREICREVFGEELIFIPYIKPGFTLAKKMAGALDKRMQDRSLPPPKGAILEKHGLITWAEDSRTSYLRTIEMVSRAEAYIKKKAGKRPAFGGPKAKPFSKELKTLFLDTFLPEFRKVLSRNKPVILHFDDSPEVVEYVCSKLLSTVSQQGPATPDHMLRTKRVPCVLTLDGDFRKVKQSFKKQLEAYAAAHEKYYQKYKQPGMFMLDPYPAVILIPGVGMVTAGKDLASAKIVAEIYQHSISVMRAASFADRYVSLSPRLAFEIEYWPLELYKMSLAPAEKELARRIALVTGATGGIGRGIAKKLAESGAHVIVTDLDLAKVQELAKELNAQVKAERVSGMRVDVTSQKSVRETFQKILHTFGGLDILVSNAGVATVAAIDELALPEWEKNFAVNSTGHFLVSQEAILIMKRQGFGGSIIFIASKNVPAPGAEFGAYSASKAACAQLARIIAIEGGAHKIRCNMVNPDGVFTGSGLWAEIKERRAKTFGLNDQELEEHYRKRNLLQIRIEPEDVAETVLFLASQRSSKTTGAMIPVDGGLREAFPR